MNSDPSKRIYAMTEAEQYGLKGAPYDVDGAYLESTPVSHVVNRITWDGTGDIELHFQDLYAASPESYVGIVILSPQGEELIRRAFSDGEKYLSDDKDALRMKWTLTATRES